MHPQTDTRLNLTPSPPVHSNEDESHIASFYAKLLFSGTCTEFKLVLECDPPNTELIDIRIIFGAFFGLSTFPTA